MLIGGAGIDSYDGGTGSDTVNFIGSAGWDIDLAAGTATTLSGGTTETLTSIENVIGSDGNDTIRGTTTANDLNGGGGDDLLIGGYGIDAHDGGAGSDTVRFSGNVGWTVDLGAGTASVGSIVESLTSIENVIGSAGGDHITGTSGANRLIGSSGDDMLIGGAGIDSYDGGTGSDTVSFIGAAGWMIDLDAGTATTLSGGTTETITAIENVIGSGGNDTIRGTAYSNSLDGGNGDDILIGGGGVDDFYGGAGFDTVDLSGSNSKWRVDLANEEATLTTASGTNYSVDFTSIENVIGPRNSVTLLGTTGNEEASGGNFADVFYTRGGVDEFHGGLGDDTLSFSGYGEGLTIRSSSGYARLGDGTEVTNFTGMENIFATSFDDDISGTAGANKILGRSGADRINGGSGDDDIQGGLGRDLLTGGRGNDRIDGGSDTNDYAFFSGNQNQYNISTSADGVTTVEWIGPGSGDGTDTLTGIEFLGFDDGFFYL